MNMDPEKEKAAAPVQHKGCAGCLGLILILFMLFVIAALVSPSRRDSCPYPCHVLGNPSVDELGLDKRDPDYRNLRRLVDAYK